MTERKPLPGGYYMEPYTGCKKLWALHHPSGALLGSGWSEKDANDFLATMNAPLSTLHRVESEAAGLREALKLSQQALNDWVVTYAPEEFSSEAVRKTYERIGAEAGTLGYIASVQERVEGALKSGESVTLVSNETKEV